MVQVYTKFFLPINFCPGFTTVYSVGSQVKTVRNSFFYLKCIFIVVIKREVSETRVVVVDWRNARGDESLIPNIVNNITNLRFYVSSMNMTSQSEKYNIIMVLNNVNILCLYTIIPKLLPWIVCLASIIIIQSWRHVHHYNILFLFIFGFLGIILQNFFKPIDL